MLLFFNRNKYYWILTRIMTTNNAIIVSYLNTTVGLWVYKDRKRHSYNFIEVFFNKNCVGMRLHSLVLASGLYL